MAVSAVFVEAYSLTIYSGVLFVVTTLVGVTGIELGLETVDCLNESLEISGLGGCGIHFLVDVGCCMF